MVTITAEYAVTQAVGLPETRLPYALLASLPASAPRAPWEARGEVISWQHPAHTDALAVLPAPIRPGDCEVTIAWALARWTDSPVGPYDEITATVIPAGDGVGHVPFVAVDVPASVVGGRANWLLPRTLATFVWSDDHETVRITGEQPEAPAWSISVSRLASGDATPTAVTSRVQQVSTEGVVRRFEGEAKGSRRAATIAVTGHSDGPLALLLQPGRYAGSVLSDCSFVIDPLTAR